MNIKNLYKREYTPANSKEGKLNTKIQRAATSWSDECPDRKEISWQIAKTCRYAMWLAIEMDKEDWECLSEAIKDNKLDPTETILAIMGINVGTDYEKPEDNFIEHSGTYNNFCQLCIDETRKILAEREARKQEALQHTGPISERTCEAGSWVMELKDGRKIPFYQGVSDRNPLYGEHATPLQFDKGSHWEIEADEKYKLYASLGPDGNANGKSIVAKRDVVNVYFERYDESEESRIYFGCPLRDKEQCTSDCRICGCGAKPGWICKECKLCQNCIASHSEESTPIDRMDIEHLNKILETATLEEGESSEVVKLAKELAKSMNVEIFQGV